MLLCNKPKLVQCDGSCSHMSQINTCMYACSSLRRSSDCLWVWEAQNKQRQRRQWYCSLLSSSIFLDMLHAKYFTNSISWTVGHTSLKEHKVFKIWNFSVLIQLPKPNDSAYTNFISYKNHWKYCIKLLWGYMYNEVYMRHKWILDLYASFISNQSNICVKIFLTISKCPTLSCLSISSKGHSSYYSLHL